MSRGRSSAMFLGFAAMATVVCPLAAGCIMTEGGEMLMDDGSDVGGAMLAITDPPDPPAGSNGDDSAGLFLTDTLNALEAMSGDPLVNNVVGDDLHIKSFPGLAASSRQFLKSSVRCALKQGEHVVDPETNETYDGWWGLASDWKNRALTIADQRWVSACMIQKLNAFGVPVMMLLEGNHSSIEYNEDLAITYDYIESTAFGNLFLGPSKIEVYVAFSEDLVSACGNAAAAIASRICDTTPACNLTTIPASAGTLVDDHYLKFVGYGAPYDYVETITARLRTGDISCYGIQ